MLLFYRKDFGGAKFEMEEALVLGPAVAEAEVTLLQDEGAIDEGVERLEEFPRFFAVFFDDLIGKAGETPDVPAEFFPYPVGNFLAGFGLNERFPAAEGEAGLAFELGQTFLNFIDFNQEAGFIVPSLRVLAAGTVIRTALGPENSTKTVAVHDIVVLERAAQTDKSVWRLELFGYLL